MLVLTSYHSLFMKVNRILAKCRFLALNCRKTGVSGNGLSPRQG